MSFDRETMQGAMSELAARGVFVGTSSWKYPGWCGQLYDKDRYVWRGRFSETRFERQCLSEYAEVFKSVCVDAAYYRFPRQEYLEGLAAQVPSDFLFSFKVTDQITIKKFTNLPRFGARAGKPNDDFLNADLFVNGFLGPCEAIRGKVGLLIFEFSRFYPGEFARGQEFAEALDGFLGKLPKEWSYGVEIRNKTFLHPDYFATLARHGVSHVYNSWQGMPPISDQLALTGSQTNERLVSARFLLSPGRRYQQAVDLFSPYQRVKEPSLEARKAGRTLIKRAAANPNARGFIYVNNRLEGNALQTIKAMLEDGGVD